MSVKLRFSNDVTNAEEEARGSDGRLNVSSRSDSRAYYNSRDNGLAFSLAYEMTLCADDEFLVYWRNASTDKDLVIHKIVVAGGEAMRVKLHSVTGTAASGTELTPTNLNLASGKAAPDDTVVMAMEGATTTPISGLTSAAVLELFPIGVASTAYDMGIKDELRLGPGDAIALEGEEIATTTPVTGTIFGFYE